MCTAIHDHNAAPLPRRDCVRGAQVDRFSSVQIAQLDGGGRVFTPDHGTCVQVVVPRSLAERVELHMPACIAGECQGAPLVEEGLEAQLISRALQGSKFGVHGNDLLLLYRNDNVKRSL
jgi:hypothetical protein